MKTLVKVVKVIDDHPGTLFLVNVHYDDGDKGLTGFRVDRSVNMGMFDDKNEPVQAIEKEDDGYHFKMYNIDTISIQKIDELKRMGTVRAYQCTLSLV